MGELARGYIASGSVDGNRTPQHIQNQIIKLYCDSNNLSFVLSRAEYWINGNTTCQLWAALKEGIKNIVFFSLWQMPKEAKERLEIYNYCMNHTIVLHFATERAKTNVAIDSFADLELLIQSRRLISANNYWNYLNEVKKLI